ncbi:UNVERIFIED_CONTAM: hypothetical protein Sradi_7122500 [Sesamum radiatum]|uniref:Uncharacterized protein n=1 Tax=Sesamum radiatum TaxID=300843 RepID=A0AAW2IYR2_SESRA
MTTFSGEGGAKYYDHKKHTSGSIRPSSSLGLNMIVKNRPFKFVDNGDAEELDHNYFVAIRSSYLTLRQGNKFIIEPYSPHRFGCQFGYFQDVPGTLKYDTRAAFLEEGLCYWRLCILSKSLLKAWFPAQSYLRSYSNVKKHGDNQVDGGENNPSPVPVPPIVVKSNSQAEVVEKGKGFSHNLVDSDSSNKDRHWKRKKKELTPLKAIRVNERALQFPLADYVAELEDEVQSIDASEESETSHFSTMTPPLGMGKEKQLPHPPAVSVFEVDFLSSIEDDVYLILEPMKSFQKFDITKVEESLNTFFVKVCAYDEARSLSSHKLSRSLHAQHLKEAGDRLQDVEAKASEGASKAQSIMDELEHVEKVIVALKGRRRSLCAALKGQKQLNHDVQAKVNEAKENVAALKNTVPLDDVIVEDLESSEANLEDLKEDLKSLNPFA